VLPRDRCGADHSAHVGWLMKWPSESQLRSGLGFMFVVQRSHALMRRGQRGTDWGHLEGPHAHEQRPRSCAWCCRAVKLGHLGHLNLIPWRMRKKVSG
jgi:hypothetical protein